MISTDISLVCALMRVTCGYWVDVAVGTEVWCFCCRNVQWAESNQFSQDRVFTQRQSLLFGDFVWLSLPPSLSPSQSVHTHCIHHHDNYAPFASMAVPFCAFLWRGAGTPWTPLTTAWDDQAQDRMISGQTAATFYELPVILQDFNQLCNPFTYLPWSHLLRDLCADLLDGARSWRDDFHSTATKKRQQTRDAFQSTWKGHSFTL